MIDNGAVQVCICLLSQRCIEVELELFVVQNITDVEDLSINLFE